MINSTFEFKLEKVKMNGSDFYQNPKNFILGPLLPSGVSFKYGAASFFLLYDSLTSCKKSEKTDKPFLRSCITNRQTDKESQIQRTLGKQK